MTAPAPATFTAATIGHALGLSKRRVLQLLEGIRPDGEREVNGNAAHAWSFPILPAAVQANLDQAAPREGCRNGLHLLSVAHKPRPVLIDGRPVSLAEVEDHHVAKAVKVRQWIQPILTEADDARASDMVKAAASALAASDRHVRRLVERAQERDRGAEEFTRLELYLDDKITRKTRPEIAASIKRERLPTEIAETITHFENPADPNDDDRAELWANILTHYQAVLSGEAAAGIRRQNCRQLLALVLSAVPTISKNLDALETKFYRKLRRWEANPDSSAVLADRRRLASGNFRRPDFAEDKETITALAVQFGGNESLAQREAIRRGLLSQEYRNYYDLDFRRHKSYVPRTIRGDITTDVDSLEDFHHGPRQHMLNRVHIPRDWSGVEPGDWFSADDVTWPVYCLAVDAKGEMIVTRCECLVMIDVRSGYVLDFILIPGKYNSRHIRKLQLSVHDKAGLPRRGNIFERGVWKARYLVGDDTCKSEHVHWRETELGMRERGVICEVRHALLPRAKTIENIFGILQSRMEAEPGYVGRNEQVEKFERTQANLRLARGGVLDALRKLYTIDEWCARLSVIIGDYNDEFQNGKMCPGKSPAEAWADGIKRKPLQKLPVEARFLLATNKRISRVHKGGITLDGIGKEPFLYANEHTAAIEGQQVLTWFNADFPEFITITDMERKSPRSISRLSLPAMDATKEQFAAVKRLQAAHVNRAKERYGQIQHRFINTVVRDNAHAPEDKEIGRFITRQEAARTEERGQQGRQLGRAVELARELGQALPATLENPQQYARSLELEKEAEEEINRLSQGELNQDDK